MEGGQPWRACVRLTTPALLGAWSPLHWLAMVRPLIQHCPSCGSPVEHRVPADDNRPRAVCTGCLQVHYQNPLVVVGTVPVWQDQVLLCRRAIEPRHGMWTLPAGFMELGESAAEGAHRETLEESGARVQLGPLFAMLNVVRVGQLHLFYRAHMQSPEVDPGVESLEARLFSEDQIPWDRLAFRTVTRTLEHHFACRRAGRDELLHGDIA